MSSTSSSSSNRFVSNILNRTNHYHQHQQSPKNKRKIFVPDSVGGGSNDMAPKLPPKPVREQARVLYSYTAQNEDELTIKEGDIISIISKENEDVGWWKGELNGRVALFPDNFVEIIKPPSATGPALPPSTTAASAGAVEDKLARVKKPDRLLSSTSSSSSTPSSPSSSSNNNNATVTSNGIITSTTNAANSSSNTSSPSASSSMPVSSNNTTDTIITSTTAVSGSSSIQMDGTSGTNNDGDGGISNTNNKLVHLTAQRPKIPTNSRRPPSVHFTAAAAEAIMANGGGGAENGFDLPPAPESPSANDTEPEKSPSAIAASSSPPEKVAPWVAELRKAQEKKREQREQQLDGKPNVVPPLIIPGTKPFVPKSSKPITTSLSTSSSSSSPSANSGNSQPSQQSLDSTSSETVVHHQHHTRNSSIKSLPGLTTTTTPTNQQQPSSLSSIISGKNDSTKSSTNSVAIDDGEFSRLKADLSELRQRLTDMDRQMQQFMKQQSMEMDKMQMNIKELTESNRKTKAIVSDVINEWAEEKKKMVIMQIEIDRLRKLNTAV